jgi:hypothetical protein
MPPPLSSMPLSDIDCLRHTLRRASFFAIFGWLATPLSLSPLIDADAAAAATLSLPLLIIADYAD